MRYGRLGLALCALLGAGLACSSLTTSTVENPYLTYTEEYGIAAQQSTNASAGASGTATTPIFRRDLTVTFRNNHPTAELNTSFVAWVNVGSISTAQQQDALLSSGYTQLSRAVTLGTAFTLPVGTFVYQGSGTAGATPILLGPAQAATETATTVTPTTTAIVLNTPDAILVYSQPPVSCESTAFYYTQNGEPLTAVPVTGGVGPYGGANTTGAFKSLAQVNVYECDPLHPGLFFSQTGAGRQSNEYLEGEDIAFDFNATADTTGSFAIVTIGTVQTTTTP